MRLTTTTFVTLDGVAQSPGAPGEDTSGGFQHGGWVTPHFDDVVGEYITEIFVRGGAYLLGRRTFDIFEAFWPHQDVDEDPVVAGRLNTKPKHVVSRTRTSSDWAGTTFHTDLRTAVEKLKAEPGEELQVHGSPSVVNQLAALDLVDEYNLLIFPAVLGSGIRLFPEGQTPRGLELVSSRTSPSGVLLTTYRSSGEPEVAAMPGNV
jgi:dihydrofolate reductase